MKGSWWDLFLIEVEFALNSITNRSTNHSPFSIVYTKVPNFSANLLAITSPKSKVASVWATDYAKFHLEIKKHIEKMNA